MRRLIKLGLLFGMVCAVLFLGGASQPAAYKGNVSEIVFEWKRGTTNKGYMIVDSSVTSANDTTFPVVFKNWNADSVLFALYINAGDTTGTADTTWIVAEGLDRWGNVIDTSLLVMDTLNDTSADNLFYVWDTKCTIWPYMRLLRITVEDTTSTGYQRDSIYGACYILEQR